MRKIKFRCWFENEMYYWDMLKADSPCLDYLKNAEIMQFTGLHDKNGKEIYEGDIVHIPYNRLGNVEVKFERGQFNVVSYDIKRLTVIGNIYENKEATQ